VIANGAAPQERALRHRWLLAWGPGFAVEHKQTCGNREGRLRSLSAAGGIRPDVYVG
jgi:hypothetical protein